MAAGKTERFGQRQIEIRYWTRACENDLQCVIEETGPEHRCRKQNSGTIAAQPDKQQKDKNAYGRQKYSRAEKGYERHQSCQAVRSELMNINANGIVKLCRVPLEDLLGEPSEKNQRRDSTGHAKTKQRSNDRVSWKCFAKEIQEHIE